MGVPTVHNLYTAPGVLEALKHMPGNPRTWGFLQEDGTLLVAIPNGEEAKFYLAKFLWSNVIQKWLLYSLDLRRE